MSILRSSMAVYKLYKCETVVYVGISSNLQVRIASHRRTKDFDRVEFAYVEDRRVAEQIEAFLIHSLNPLLNNQNISGRVVPGESLYRGIGITWLDLSEYEPYTYISNQDVSTSTIFEGEHGIFLPSWLLQSKSVIVIDSGYKLELNSGVKIFYIGMRRLFEFNLKHNNDWVTMTQKDIAVKLGMSVRSSIDICNKLCSCGILLKKVVQTDTAIHNNSYQVDSLLDTSKYQLVNY